MVDNGRRVSQILLNRAEAMDRTESNLKDVLASKLTHVIHFLTRQLPNHPMTMALHAVLSTRWI